MKWWLWLLCILGAVRVLAFSAAYPVFDYIDETLHCDVVLTFARVGVPGRGEDLFDREAARMIATYGLSAMSPPYQRPYADLPPAERQAAIEKQAAYLAGCRNAETLAPPLYYAIAAAWYRLGAMLGLRDVALLYWLRFLGAPVYGAAMWLACRICTEFHPRRRQGAQGGQGGLMLALAVALILAALPQDIFYTINSDVFSPLVGALALYLVLRWMHAPRPSMGLAACAGAAASAAMLGKYSNVGALAIVPVAALIVIAARRRRSLAEIVTLLICTAVPLGLWMLRCRLVFGDWTALKDKYEQIGWTVLPLAQSLKHPIFTPLGVLEFLTRLCVTFWRGEIIFDNFVQRVPAADAFYLVISALGLLGTLGWLLRPSPAARPERTNAIVCFAMVAAQVVFLALISARFDYGNFFFPSRGFPYFAAGRMLTGVIVPVAILLCGGLAELLEFTRRRWAIVIAAGVIAAVCLGSEIYLCCIKSPVFASRHNFYHLLAK